MPLSTINNRLPFAVSLGEPSGIGPEVILKSWMDRNQSGLPGFFVIGTKDIFARTARKLGLDIPLQGISSPDEACHIFPQMLPVLELVNDDDFTFGVPSTITAPLVLASIEKAVDLIFAGEVAGLITAPIQKSILYDAGFDCPGHTEYLAKLCEKQTGQNMSSVMMLVSDELRVVPLTIHLPLTKVAQSITPDLIINTCGMMITALQKDFAIENPRITVAGLNPHAGEDGSIGKEEQNMIKPALDLLRAKGGHIQGPLPADTMFHKQARMTYDAALCMYHDQALIPIKTLDFEGGVNVTIGLPIIRTSPDHGTALNIAGQNKANPTSMINALKLADLISRNRMKWAAKHV